MSTIRTFFKLMFSEWGSGLSGPASVPFAVLALFASAPTQKWAYGLLAITLGFVSAYRIWAKEHGRLVEQLERNATLERDYLDDRPQFGLTIYGPEGPTPWQNAWSSDSCHFTLQHLSGRIARSIRFDPVPSLRGKFLLVFEPVPFLEPPRATRLTYRVEEPAFPSVNAHDREKIGDIQGRLLGKFLEDSPAQLLERTYPLHVTYLDKQDQERTHDFFITFDMRRLRFLSDTTKLTQSLTQATLSQETVNRPAQASPLYVVREEGDSITQPQSDYDPIARMSDPGGYDPFSRM